jgi:hypothetical protein
MAERRLSIFRKEYSKRHLLFWRYGVVVKMEENQGIRDYKYYDVDLNLLFWRYGVEV